MAFTALLLGYVPACKQAPAKRVQASVGNKCQRSCHTAASRDASLNYCFQIIIIHKALSDFVYRCQNGRQIKNADHFFVDDRKCTDIGTDSFTA